MTFLKSFQTNVIKIEEKRIPLRTIKTGKQSEDGKDILEIEYQNKGWFVHLEGSWESLHIGFEQPDLQPGDIMHVTLRSERKTPTETKTVAPYPVKLPDVPWIDILGYFLYVRANGKTWCEKIDREIYPRVQGTEAYAHDRDSRTTLLTVKLDKADWALPLWKLAEGIVIDRGQHTIKGTVDHYINIACTLRFDALT